MNSFPLFSVFLKQFVQCRPADSQFRCNRRLRSLSGHIPFIICLNVRNIYFLPPLVFAGSLGNLNSFTLPLQDHGPLKFSYCGHHGHLQASCRRFCIKIFFEAYKFCPGIFNLLNDRQQIRCRSTQPGKLFDINRVIFPDVFQQLLQLRTLCILAGCFLDEPLIYIVWLQGLLLPGFILLNSGDSDIGYVFPSSQLLSPLFVHIGLNMCYVLSINKRTDSILT